MLLECITFKYVLNTMKKNHNLTIHCHEHKNMLLFRGYFTNLCSDQTVSYEFNLLSSGGWNSDFLLNTDIVLLHTVDHLHYITHSIIFR